MEEYKYLIIGNSAGGIGAAESIRQADKKGSLCIISDEPYPAYSRVRISDHLARECPLEEMLFRPVDFYKANDIRLTSGKKVEQLCTKTHTVKLVDGTKIKYQKLLLATGGLPIKPSINGMDNNGVFCFTSLDDAIAISNYINTNDIEEAVVIGGGLIGISATEALVKRGIKVTVFELKERILNTILDDEASAMEAKAMADEGVEIITGQTITQVNTNPINQEKINSISLDDGQELACRLVIIAIGVTPRTELAISGGLEVKRGISVDSSMATSRADIYACGDVAEIYDFIYGENRLNPIWPNAYLGGRVAGFNMAGIVTTYQCSTVMNTIKYFGVDIISAGITVPPDDSYRTFSQRNGGTYRKVIIKDNQVAGMVFTSDIEKSGIILNLMKYKIDVSQFCELLVSDEFGLSCLPEEVWRPHLVLPAELTVEA